MVVAFLLLLLLVVVVAVFLLLVVVLLLQHLLQFSFELFALQCNLKVCICDDGSDNGDDGSRDENVHGNSTAEATAAKAATAATVSQSLMIAFTRVNKVISLYLAETTAHCKTLAIPATLKKTATATAAARTPQITP